MAIDRSIIAKFFRDPLFHFLVVGALIYGGFYLLEDNAETARGDEKTIVVTQGEIEWLRAQWQGRWGRAPTPDEMDGLIDGHIHETVLYREALALDLDKEDVVIRRRLGQKLEFLSAGLLEPAPPSDAERAAYFAENTDRYRGDDLVSMTHVYFDADKRGDQTLSDAAKALAELKTAPGAPSDTNGVGDRFLLQSYYPNVTERELARQFGAGFADPVFQLEPELWHGPVLSGYGTHLVYIHSHITAPEPKLEEVAQRVVADWLDDKRAELSAAFKEQLIAQYVIEIEDIGSDGDIEPKAVN